MGNDSSTTRRSGGGRGAMPRRDFLKAAGAGVAGTALLGSTACDGFTSAVEGTSNSLVFSFGPDDSGVVQAVIDMFNKKMGGKITVEYREMPADTGQYFDKLRTEFQSGVAVNDVIGADVIWPAQLAANGWLEPLDELFTEEMQSDYISAPLDTGRYNDKIYSVPWYADAGMLYYRKDLLDKNGIKSPPKTWEELYDIGAKVAGAEGLGYGYVGQGAEYEGGVCNGCEFVWNGGGEIQDPNDLAKIVIDSPEAMAGLEAGQKVVSSGVAPVAFATFKELESLTVFLNQDAVFMRNWPFAYGGLADPALGTTFDPKKVYEQVLVTTLPVTEAGQENFACLGGWTFAINALSSKKEQAWEFIKFMITPEIRETFTIDRAAMPPERSFYEDKKLIKEQPLLEVAKDAIASTKPRPIHPYYSDMSLRMAESFNENIKSEISPQQAISTLQTQMQRIADTNVPNPNI